MASPGGRHFGPAWTEKKLKKLCAALKKSIPRNKKILVYQLGLKDIDWEKVAFAPFSAEECKNKWTEIQQHIRKTRTLTEIIVEAEDAISNPKKYMNYKKILEVCANFPKRPSTAASVFFGENFALFKKKHPGSSQQQILKALLKKYKNLPEKEKAIYVEKHQLAAKKYQREMREFRQKIKCPETKRKRVSEKSSGEGEISENVVKDLPKPPSSGYHLFCKEHMVSAEIIPGKKNLAIMGQRWRVLAAEDKEEYNRRCREIKTQYSAKLEEYLKNCSTRKQEQILTTLGIKKLISSKPKKRRRNAFTFFVQEHLGQLNKEGVAPRTRLAKISELWSNLSEEQKEPYRRKVAEDLKKYKLEQKAWFEKLTPEQQEDNLRKKNKDYWLDVTDQVDLDQEDSEQDNQFHGPGIPPCTGSSPLQPHRPSDSEDDSMDSSTEEDSDSEDDAESEDQKEAWGDDVTFEIF